MLPASFFQQVITIQNRDLSDPDPMESSTDWADVETLFCMAHMLMMRLEKPYDAAQPVGLQPSVKFTVRGEKTFPLGETRIVWGNDIYEPTSITFYPGIFRNEELTYIYAQKTSGLTAP